MPCLAADIDLGTTSAFANLKMLFHAISRATFIDFAGMNHKTQYCKSLPLLYDGGHFEMQYTVAANLAYSQP